MTKWVIGIEEHANQSKTSVSIKGQALADLLTEISEDQAQNDITYERNSTVST